MRFHPFGSSEGDFETRGFSSRWPSHCGAVRYHVVALILDLPHLGQG